MSLTHSRRAGTTERVNGYRVCIFYLAARGRGGRQNGGTEWCRLPAHGGFLLFSSILEYHLDSKSSMQVDMGSVPPP